MAYIARGRRQDLGYSGPASRKFVYLTEPETGYYQWNGEDRAREFDTAAEALLAATRCVGPWFNVPKPNSVRAVSHHKKL